MEIWEDVERPGYFGRRRDEIHARLTQAYPGGWRVVWKDASGFVYPFAEACKRFYEEAYYQFFVANREVALWLTAFQDVYDNALTNLQSGRDYTKQEAVSTHIQDIAVRCAMDRMGLCFAGARLLEIRSHGEGVVLSPGRVPFHEPAWIVQPSLAPRWAARGSVEDFWQSNKVIQARRH